VGAAALALPLAGFVVLRVSGGLDRQWQHDTTHFWIVFGAALLSAVTAYGTGAAAVRRGDVRVMYVSLAFLSAAGFLGLHALATPHVLLDSPSVGFNVSTPTGIALGSLFAVASVREVAADEAAAEMRRARRFRLALLVAMAAWGVASLLRLPPFDVGPGPERSDTEGDSCELNQPTMAFARNGRVARTSHVSTRGRSSKPGRRAPVLPVDVPR